VSAPHPPRQKRGGQGAGGAEQRTTMSAGPKRPACGERPIIERPMCATVARNRLPQIGPAVRFNRSIGLLRIEPQGIARKPPRPEKQQPHDASGRPGRKCCFLRSGSTAARHRNGLQPECHPLLNLNTRTGNTFTIAQQDQDARTSAHRVTRRCSRGYVRIACVVEGVNRHGAADFVLSDGNEDEPLYVTRLIGAPQPLRDAVYEYDRSMRRSSDHGFARSRSSGLRFTVHDSGTD
jgi:hypothetical protein